MRDLSNINHLAEIPSLLHLLSNRVGSLANTSEISRTLSIPNTTLTRYLTLLKQIFLLVTLPPYFKNATKRLVKTPKIYLNDTGLVNYRNNCDIEHLRQNASYRGYVLENFIVMEFFKQKSWSRTPFNMYHYRSHTGSEVDIILERFDGKCIAIEIKSCTNIAEKDFKGIKNFEEGYKPNFLKGIVLYQGKDILPFKENWLAVPISKMWKMHPYKL